MEKKCRTKLIIKMQQDDITRYVDLYDSFKNMYSSNIRQINKLFRECNNYLENYLPALTHEQLFKYMNGETKKVDRNAFPTYEACKDLSLVINLIKNPGLYIDSDNSAICKLSFLSWLVRCSIDSNQFTMGKWITFGTSFCTELCLEIQNKGINWNTVGSSAASWENFMKLYDWIDSKERTFGVINNVVISFVCQTSGME